MNRVATAAAVVVATAVLAPTSARADEDEATVELHLFGGVARVGEERTSQVATVPEAGVAGRFTYGLRDWLALDGELAAAQLGAARFDAVPVTLGGVPGATGPIDRSARTARAAVGATLRLGVRLVPTLGVAIGSQLRMRDGATYLPTGNIPDDHAASTTIDLIASARIGLDYRINRRWLAGLWAGATVAVPFGAPSYQAAEGGVRVEYAWYPLW